MYTSDVSVKISACVMCKNSERTIEECLESLQSFDEIIVLDTGSTDGTLEIVAKFPKVRFKRQENIEHFGKARNQLAAVAQNDWIFMVDSDEVVTKELFEEIYRTPLEVETVYAPQRLNHYAGRPVFASVWYPEFIRRLYNRRATEWSDRVVHEAIIVKEGMKCLRLRGKLLHYSWRGIGDLLGKYTRYAGLYAEDNRGKHKASPLQAVLRGSWSFFRSYILRRGIFYGYDGFILSFGAAFGSFMKYVKLYELNRRQINETTTECSSSCNRGNPLQSRTLPKDSTRVK